MPGDDLPGKQVHNNAEIIPFTTGFNIGEITYPNSVWSLLIKTPVVNDWYIHRCLCDDCCGEAYLLTWEEAALISSAGTLVRR